MSDPTHTTEQTAQRRTKLEALRERGNPYPNDFARETTSREIHEKFADDDADNLAAQAHKTIVAGRLMTRRVMGKASFAHLQDVAGAIQIYVRRDDLPEGQYGEFKALDIGDIIGVHGEVFRTKKGELSVKASDVRLLAKSLHPLPEKFHGLSDQETRYRQRYLDLITSDEARTRFRKRSAIVHYIRDFFLQREFLEVETPMMQAIAGGAAARPFKTHHNALDMALFLRIAPELYLKRLVVGGFERVFEINRNFRNEGVSTRHNPEFTMLEFYQAYATYLDCMTHTEDLMRGLAQSIVGSTSVPYQGEVFDFAKPFERMTVKDSILRFNPDLTPDDLDDVARARVVAQRLDVKLEKYYGLGKVWIEIFEKTVEGRLKDPTFITAYPTEVSPLSRKNDADPFVTDRFEFFVGGREIANGFSELNDPDDQAERFRAQMEHRDAGDVEAMDYDHDYVRALEHGMPPTAGEGIGIDRVVMLLTDAPSIRDVLLFPYMRPETAETNA